MMNRNRLIWKLFPYFLIIGLSTLFIVSWYGSRSFRNFYINETADDLKARSRLFIQLLSDYIIESDFAVVDSLCRQTGLNISSRITVIMPDGKVIGDTESEPSLMDNHADRPEIIEAIRGEIGRRTRYSYTLNTEMLYVAVPAYYNGEVIAVIRSSVALTSLDQALKIANRQITGAAILIALLIAIASFIISRKISKPIELLKTGAESFSRGDFEHKIHIKASVELNSLAAAMNEMASELDRKIRDLDRQHNERKAIFSSMVEGVLAVDLEKKIIDLNKSAADLLDVDPNIVRGQGIQEAVRNVSLQSLVTRTLSSQHQIEDEIVIHNGDEIYLQAHGTPLIDHDNRRFGVLIVLENITQIKKLENIRRQFVANVSHELKTPITSIKGYIETLLDGVAENTEDARRFLEITLKHSDRLNAIIDDLLQLSKIEQDSEKGEIELRTENVKSVLQTAIQFCGYKAGQKNVHLALSCPSELGAKINTQLLEQAVINLIDNAISFSESGSTIHVNALKTQDEIIIEVEDMGCGIDRKHLPRLFEHFYRVDKSRSRKNGGTGLGLAIVKHIAQAHGGRSSVESQPGKGSTFRIHLPEN